jgi:hypothetical protein
MQTRLKHLLYAVFVLTTLCALFEIGLRVYDSATGQITRKQLYDRGFTAKSWKVHHANKASQAFAVKNPDTQRRVRVAFNSFGLRGPEPALPKPAGLYRVLCLGDEATLAAHLNEDETFAGRLQGAWQQGGTAVEVLNGGVPESCPLLAYLWYRHELLGLEPDLVILSFDMTDVADDYAYRRRTVVSADGLPLVCAHPDLEVPKTQRASKWEETFLLPEYLKSRAREWFAEQTFRERAEEIGTPQGRYAWLKDDPPDWSLHIAQALSPIEALAQLVGNTGGRVVVVIAPAPWQVAATASNGPKVRERAGLAANQVFRSRRPFDLVTEYCRQKGIAVCDTSSAMQADSSADRLFLKNAGILSAEGHAVIAGELARFLAEAPVEPATPRELPVRHAAFP